MFIGIRRLGLSSVIGASIVFLSAGCGRTILKGDAPRAVLPPGREITIWFVKPAAQGLEFVPVKRRSGEGDRLEQAVTELLYGPTPRESALGVASEIPRGTILLSVKRAGSSVELNLSRRFAAGAGDSIVTRIAQLSRTVAQVSVNQDVYLSVEGQRLNVDAGDGLPISQPINR